MSPGGANPDTSPGPQALRAHVLQYGPALAQGEKLLVLGPLQHAGHAPGDVVVDRGDLAGPPHQPDDREGAVRFRVQQVLLVRAGITLPLGGGEDVGGPGQVPGQGPGHPPGGQVPAAALPDGAAQGGEEGGRAAAVQARR